MDHDPDTSFNRDLSPDLVIQILIRENNGEISETRASGHNTGRYRKSEAASKFESALVSCSSRSRDSVPGRRLVDVNTYTFRCCKRILGRAARSTTNDDNIEPVLHFNACSPYIVI